MPDIEDEPAGLAWDQLTDTLTSAASRDGRLGLSIAIYDPEQYPDRSGARQILRLITDVLARLPAAPE